MRHVIAVDPGVTRTGVCHSMVADCNEHLVLAAATFSSPSDKFSREPTHQRVCDLTRVVYKWVKDSLNAHIDVRDTVAFAIERPIYNKNARAFEVQWRLFQRLCGVFADEYDASKISEVHNGTAKAALTNDGSASKEKMVAHSPFSVAMFPFLIDREAVTDAYAIGLAVDKGNPIYPAEWEKYACVVGANALWVADE